MLANKIALGTLVLAGISCASTEPKVYQDADKSVERAERKDADDLTPRMMELANRQLEKAEDLFDEAENAKDNKNYVKADRLTRQAIKLAKSSKAIADNAVAINSDVLSWDRNPADYEKLRNNSQKFGKMRDRLNSMKFDKKYQADLNGLEFMNSLPVAFFPTESATPKQDFASNTKNLAKFLMANESSSVKLTGYADPRGGEEYNKVLAEQRAQTIKNLLTNEGVPSNRILISSAGEVDAKPSSDEAQLQLYRKVEATIQSTTEAH